MNTRTSFMAHSALILLLAPFAANAADTSGDAQSMARDLLSGKAAHVASVTASAPSTPASAGDFDAQQHAARLLTGTLSHQAANGRQARSTPAATSSPLTARNDDLQAAARRLLQGQSLD
jgi:hypothetical protein